MKWSSIIVSAYLPTLMSSLGYGAVIPLIPLTAVHNGASAALAAAIAALVGIGQIIGDVPAGWLVTKIGEKWSLVIAMLIDAMALGSMGWPITLDCSPSRYSSMAWPVPSTASLDRTT